MKRFQEQLKKKSEGIRLSVSERNDLRDRVVSYMEYHPLPKEIAEKRVDPSTIVSEAYTTVKFDMFMIGRYLGAFAVLFVIIVPIVAERAVPGDALYPVKVGFNEEVRSTLALSPYQKVEWETARLERRIAEARLLASEGKLTPEVEAEVAEAVKAHSAAAQKEIESLRETDGEEAAIAGIALTSALDVQSEFLEGQLSEVSTTTEGHSVVALASVVDEARESAHEAAVEEEISSARLLAQIETETTRAFEFIAAIEDVASNEERKDIERRLSDINTKIEEAQSDEDEAAAIELLTEALSDTRKLISFMSNIEVREHVTVEELVPVILTDQEKTTMITANLSKIDEQLAVIETRRPFLPEDVAEKTDFGLDQIETLTASSSVDGDDIDAALQNSKDALTLADDIAIFTEPYREEQPGVVEEVVATSTEEVIAEDEEDVEAEPEETEELEEENIEEVVEEEEIVEAEVEETDEETPLTQEESTERE